MMSCEIKRNESLACLIYILRKLIGELEDIGLKQLLYLEQFFIILDVGYA